jgi:phage tail sheath gpL-like
MGISVEGVPSKLRIPSVNINISNRLAGNGVIDFKSLYIGIKLSTGSAAANQLIRANNKTQLEEAFGRGSMLAEMGKIAINASPFTEKWFIALDEPAAGVAASGSLTVNTVATRAGTLFLYIAGYRLQVGVSATDTTAEIAQAVVDAVNNYKDDALPVTAAIDGGNTSLVNFTCKWKGETGNDIDIRLNYFDGEELPKGVTLSLVNFSGGTGSPDINDVITAIADEWYNWFANPFTDGANMTKLATELDSRYGPMRQIGGRAFSAYRGTHSATGTYGGTGNTPHISMMGTNLAMSPTWLWAAANTAVASLELEIDPARQLRTIALPGIYPAAKEDRWNDIERNQLLFDGIATHTVDRDGTVRIERQITMYQENDAGFSDDSFLDITTPETLERIRFEQRAHISLKFPRHKLADNGYDIPEGQPIVTPKALEVEFLVLYRKFEDKGWVQDYEDYKETLHAEINADDNNRVDMYQSPILIYNLRNVAVQTEHQ